ncbi:O-methyltransferase [Zhouia sp. PK063]|uniref:O-methyltransferase n=1 Tax=Zhouia sp. PK063 TaxID=3373602 RepID=UPI00379153CA
MYTLYTSSVHQKLDILHQEVIKDFKKRKLKEQETDEIQPKQNAFMAVTQEEGTLLYLLARTAKGKHIVEYGCSFGISTIYLAAAQDNNENVITSELKPNKVKAPIDFLFLDGTKEYYLPIFKMLEPQLTSGTIVVADNADKTNAKPFIDYMTSLSKKYTSSFLFNGRILVSYTHNY